MSAVDARRDRLRFRAIAGPDQAAHAAALADNNLSREGREKVTAPLGERLKAAHHRTDRELGELVTAAEGEVTRLDPRAVVQRYGGEAPAKVTAAAGFAALETSAGLLTYARDRASAKDYASCHGIALALRKRAELAPDERTAIVAALAEPHRARYEGAVASLIGVKVERMRHQLEGPFNARDLSAFSPEKTLTACYESQQYVDPATGATVSLSDDAVAEMLKVNGYARDIGHEEDE